MARKVNQRTLDLLWLSEGEGDKLADGRYIAYCDRNATSANPYYDHTSGGLWTIGPGVTGPMVHKGTIMTKVQVEKLMNAELQKVGAYIEARVTVKLTDNQYGALCDFGYNLGVGHLDGIINHINSGNNDAAMSLLLQFVYGTSNGQKVKLRGLVTRRYREKELFEWEDRKQLKALSAPMRQMDTVQNTTLVTGGITGFLWTNWQQFRDMLSDHTGVVILVALGIGYFGPMLVKKVLHNLFDKGEYVPEGTKPVDEIVIPEDAQ